MTINQYNPLLWIGGISLATSQHWFVFLLYMVIVVSHWEEEI